MSWFIYSVSGSEVALNFISRSASTSWCSGNMDLRKIIYPCMWLLVAVSISCCIISIWFILLSIVFWVYKSELICCVSGCCWLAFFVGSPWSLLFGRITFDLQFTLRVGVFSWFGINVDSKFGCVLFVVFCNCFGFFCQYLYWKILLWSAIEILVLVLASYGNRDRNSRGIEDLITLL